MTLDFEKSVKSIEKNPKTKIDKYFVRNLIQSEIIKYTGTVSESVKYI